MVTSKAIVERFKAARPSTRLDQILDQVERGKREVTIDADGYSPEQVDKIIAEAKSRGLNVSGTYRWLLIRKLGNDQDKIARLPAKSSS